MLSTFNNKENVFVRKPCATEKSQDHFDCCSVALITLITKYVVMSVW